MSFGKEEVVAIADATYKVIYSTIGSKAVGPGDVNSVVEASANYFKALANGDYRTAVVGWACCPTFRYVPVGQHAQPTCCWN